ncbi:MAG: DUF2059 domain-containing protein [Pseudomonadota bacterium]
MSLALALAVIAAPASAEPTARQLELAKRYVAATSSAKRLEATFAATMTAVMPIPGSDEAQQKRMARVMSDIMIKMTSRLAEKMAPVMADTFTEAELEAIVAFYEGPAGKSLLDKTPEISAKLAPAMREITPEMFAEVAARRCEIITCPPKDAPATEGKP